MKKLRKKEGTSRIQQGREGSVCAEREEKWGYVGEKERKRWLF
ncbi:hypothetical protein DAH34_28040 [Escherichia coli]|nr:hypothetical protein DAH34_28040 [Escherichia coli]